jgi:hypothetical protein
MDPDGAGRSEGDALAGGGGDGKAVTGGESPASWFGLRVGEETGGDGDPAVVATQPATNIAASSGPTRAHGRIDAIEPSACRRRAWR